MNKEILINLYSTDPELLSKYHILAPNSAENCAERTYTELVNANIDIHLINKDNKIIGYYGLEKTNFINNLCSFFIIPEYRNKETITNFWNEIDSSFDGNYFIGVYSKNTRVIEFLKKKTELKYNVNDDKVFFMVGR